MELYNHVLMNRLILDGELSPYNFVLPLDAFTCKRTAYIVMEGIEGMTLHEYLLSHRDMAPAQFARLLLRLAEVTAQLERLDISHNDLHLRNVIVGIDADDVGVDGDLVVIDYGRIAREGDPFFSGHRFVLGFDNFSIIASIVSDLIMEETLTRAIKENPGLDTSQIMSIVDPIFARPWQDNIAGIRENAGIYAVLEHLSQRLPHVTRDNELDFSIPMSDPEVYAALARYNSQNFIKILREYLVET
ncbi:MAG: lipopolysaccharide kinase InaA family protein [Sulfobacillus sp.]